MVELRVLGPLNLVRDRCEAPALIAQPKRLALFCYLALTPAPGFRRRDSLVALFWPELSGPHARAALRQAIHVVRRALGDDVILSRGAEEIGVDRRVVWCDALAFDEHLRENRPDAALALYAGPLLEGFYISDAPLFEEWLEERRNVLAAKAARSAWSLSTTSEHAGDMEAAVRWARRAFALTPDDETALALLLGLLMRSGDRCGAVREYERFARRLRREYGIEPAPATETILREARATPHVAGPAAR